jgi:hypothetical protein
MIPSGYHGITHQLEVTMFEPTEHPVYLLTRTVDSWSGGTQVLLYPGAVLDDDDLVIVRKRSPLANGLSPDIEVPTSALTQKRRR